MRKFLKRLQLKISQHGKGNSQRNPRGTESPTQDKLKEKHAKTHTHQTKTKHKERILKAAREKQQVTYKGNPIGLTADLSAETPQSRRQWQNIFKILEGKNLHPRLLYLARISFKIDGEIKSFSDKQVKRIQYHQLAIQQVLKGLIQSRNTREEKRSTKSFPNN